MLHKDILWDVIPASEKRRILSQDECELDIDFLGFTEVYRSLSKIIPKHFTVIDFGCYLAAQCYCFGNHKKYVGVDIVDMGVFASKYGTLRHVYPKVHQGTRANTKKQPLLFAPMSRMRML